MATHLTELGMRGVCVIDVEEEWIVLLKKELAKTSWKQSRCEPRTIFRVPDNIRKTDPGAYVPKIISFGPYHHGQPHLKAMDELKIRYLHKILQRKPALQLEHFYQVVKALESRARSSYSDMVLKSDEFEKMLLLDGCFIVQLLLMDHENSIEKVVGEEEDPMVDTAWALSLVEFDMLKLENQLPFFVLEALFDLATATDAGKIKSYTLTQLAINFFRDLFPSNGMVPSAESVPRFYHLLHLFHSCMKPAQHNPANSSVVSNPSEHNLASLSISKMDELNMLMPEDYKTDEFQVLQDQEIEEVNVEALAAQHNPVNSSHSEISEIHSYTKFVGKSFPQLHLPSQHNRPRSIVSRIDKLKKLMSHLFQLHSTNCSCFGCGKHIAQRLTQQSVPCAMELEDAGVEFKKNKNAESFLDVKFGYGLLCNAVMWIPQLPLHDETNVLLRNLIAFEQCFLEAGNYVTSYAAFMDMIIDTPDDVALLQRKGVIINHLGSGEEAAAVFNKLCKGVALDQKSSYLAKLFMDVKKHCDCRVNKWRAKMMRDYFSTPWSLLSFLAALLILSLTIVQTAFTVQAYYHPSS